MIYRLALRTNRPAELLPAFARLQAGGFHPIIPNFHHGTIAAGYVIALGGFDILLPDREIEDAKIWMSDITPIEDFDPIRDRPVRDIFQASILTMNPFFLAYCWPPTLLLCLWMAFIVLLSFSGFGSPAILILANASTLCIIGILAHARHIAAKKIRPTP